MPTGRVVTVPQAAVAVVAAVAEEEAAIAATEAERR